MSGYSVDMAELARVGTLVEQRTAHARSALGELRSAARSALGSGWQSPAGVTFRHGWEEWADGAAAMLAALDELGAAVRASGGGYDQTESAVQAATGRASA